MKTALSLVALLAVSIACAADPDRAALEAAIQRWTMAVNAQDVAAMNAAMTDDLSLLNDTRTFEGRETALPLLRQVATQGQITSTSLEITIANDVAWCVGAVTQARRNGDVHSLGQTLAIWKRVNGKWKLHRLMAPGLFTPNYSPLTRPPPNEPVLDRQ
jgi:ketosteroid isomerase-like protein